MDDPVHIIGIDPGGHGGFFICRYNPKTNSHNYITSIPFYKTEKEIVAELESWTYDPSEFHDCFALLEKVHSMPKQGVKSSFTFGQEYGFIRGVLVTLGIRFNLVEPRMWQKEFDLIRRDANETITEKKNRHKAVAQKLFPTVKMNHYISDAALICRYAIRNYGSYSV